MNMPRKEPWLDFIKNTPSFWVRALHIFKFKMNFLDPVKARKFLDRLTILMKTKQPFAVRIEEIKFPNFNATRITPEKPKKEKVLLYLHGGAYIAGGGNYCRLVGTNIAKYTVWQTVVPDYRLAPEYPFPAALEDALAAYHALLEQGIEPTNIVLFGDSAGGGLCFALCHKLKDCKIPLPKAIIALSPWTDLSLSGESYTTNIKKDPIFSLVEGNPVHYYVPDDRVESPYISPMLGDFSGFPGIFIIVGENEILLSDSLLLGEKAYAQGVNVQVQVWEGMFHVFPIISMIPESKKAMHEILTYINNSN